MSKCPKCGKEVTKPEKKWKYRQFAVEAYVCGNCETEFRDYSQKGKHSFTLEKQKGTRFRKA
jgi:DNA-directed RNA polymerase subunit RPC12/RpoP